MRKKLTAYKKKKMTLYEFVVIGFNYTAAIGFVGSFALLSDDKSKNSIGMHALWVFPLVAILAGTIAWAFARLSEVHKSSNNGAAYIYVRSSFGRFVGAMILMIRYGLLPLLIVIQILFLIKGSFSPGYVGPDSPFKNVFSWAGSFSDLFLDVVGIAIYGAAALSLVFGMKFFKYTNKYMSWIKWGTSALLVLAALYIAFKDPKLGYWTTSVSKGGGNHINFEGVVQAFIVFFFYFAGFETYSTSGRNIQNPNRNIKLGIMLIMLSATLLYVVVGFIFFAAYNGHIDTSQGFRQNMNIGGWAALNVKWLALAGAIIMLLGQLAMKIQVAVLNSLYGGTSLQPLAKEGYISDWFKKLGRDNLPIRASLLNLTVVGLLSIVWLFIPDTLVAAKVFSDQQISTALSVNALLSTSSSVTIFVYGVVVLAFVKLSYQRKITTKMWEWIAMPLIIVILFVLFVYHYYDVINKATTGSAHLVAAFVELFFVIVLVAVSLIIYFAYYKPKYIKRLKYNPEIQQKLDKEFVVIDDWMFVAMNLRRSLKRYKTRNFALYESHSNEHYKFANSIYNELEVAIEEFEVREAERRSHDEDKLDE